MKKQILILCAIFLLIGNVALAQGNWISADENISSTIVPSSGTLTVSGTYTWNSVTNYSNDNHMATLTYALPQSVMVFTGSPSLVYANSNMPVQGVSFASSNQAWTCTFSPGTNFAPGTKLLFSISNLEIMDDKVYQNQLASHFISFLSSPANDLHMDNAGTAVFETTIAGPLPVTLVNFNATLREQGVNAKVDLSWKTTLEINADRFIIERSSNAVDWAELTSVQANGNSTTTTDYQAIDSKPFEGRSYYRLKQLDRDNRFVYSKVKTVNNFTSAGIQVYPNPTTDLIYVQYSLDKAYAMELQLLTIDGRIAKTIKSNGKLGANTIELSIAELANGIYELNILQNAELINTIQIQKK